MEKSLRAKLKDGRFKEVDPIVSKRMSKIRGKNNRSTELLFQMILVRCKIKNWKRSYDSLPGKPDFFFPKKRIAIFVDGCFWHGCPICGRIPKKNTEFWVEKITKNKKRDRSVNMQLRKMGITPLHIWEHELKQDTKNLEVIMTCIIK